MKKKYASSLLILLLIFTFNFAFTQSNSRPNIILIMLDDMGFECIDSYGNESGAARSEIDSNDWMDIQWETPNLTEFTKNAIQFNNAHSQPVCSPSRVQIMTGKYNSRNYTRFAYLEQDQKTFGNYFQDAGYRTSVVGKWQLGGNTQTIKDFGFNDHCLWKFNGHKGGRYTTPAITRNGLEQFYEGEYGPDIMLQHAKGFISDSNNDNQPFFLYYPMMLVHYPFKPTPFSLDWDPTENDPEEDISASSKFADMMGYMDFVIGDLMNHLRSLDLEEETMVIFTSDNGTNERILTRTQDGRIIIGGKEKTSEAGTHIPLIVHWKSKIDGIKTSEDLIDFSDILVTITETAGITIPPCEKQNLDGISFLPQLLGETGTPRDYSYFYYQDRQDVNYIREFSHDVTYKLFKTGEFYNKINDPDEESPLPNASLTLEQRAIKTKLRDAISYHTNLRDGPCLTNSIVIDSPFEGEMINLSTDFAVRATIKGFNDPIKQVLLFVDGERRDQDDNVPYKFGGDGTFSNLTLGEHTIKLVAVTEEGLRVATSVKITIKNTNDPTIIIKKPDYNATFNAGENFIVEGKIFNIDTAIDQVILFVDGVRLDSQTNTPYEFGADGVLSGLSPGEHTIRLVAIDTNGDRIDNEIKINIIGTLATAEFINKSLENSFLVPNPAHSVVTIIGASADTKWQVFDFLGREIKSGKGDRFSLEDAKSGIYIVLLENKISHLIKKM